MLKSKPIYAPADPGDGRRILVTRFYPRGVKRERFDEWARELAPSAALLRLYKRGRVGTADYSAKYMIELDCDRARRTLRRIKRDADAGNVTLLCYEPEGAFCHRDILKEIMQSGSFEPEGAGRRG